MTVKTTLNVGDRVMIYEDPLTREVVEDEATLVQRVDKVSPSQDRLCERWIVRFDDDEETYERSILVE